MKIRYTYFPIIFLLVTMATNAQQRLFEPGQCTLYSEDNEKVAYTDTIFKGQKALKLDSKKHSIALMEGIEAKNFRVEMDIAGKVMSGLGFHAQDGLNYQFIYFRPGMGGTREAIQYIPIFNGALSWVFYNYPVYETTADVRSLEWFHAVFEVRGKRLKVFVNGESEPKMNITLLENPKLGGKLLLRSMFGPSYFANITYQQLPEEDTKTPVQPKADFLTDWKISKQFPRGTTDDYFKEVLTQANKANQWRNINELEDTYINLSRYFDHPQGVLVAKTTINAKNTTQGKLHFDFVGRIKILLNGKALFDYHKIKFERVFDGTFSIGLPLQKGDNELTVIAEGDASFFGKGFKYLGRSQHTNWGFIGRLEK
ncbi:hypothetical protein FGF1_11330 [Flavobacteriaceae bacterium GF1]